MVDTKGIIYLQKDKFDFYIPISGKVIEFRFVPEIVQDLEVINAELLENLIKLFVESNKIAISELIIVIADNACFVQDFLQTTPAGELQNFDEQTKKFVESVPFDDVASATFPLKNGIKVLATNRTLFESIVTSFEKLGFKTQVVLPGVVFGGDMGVKTTLDVIAANIIFQNLDTVRQHNLLEKKIEESHEDKDAGEIKAPEQVGQDIEVNDKPSGKKSNKRIFLLVGVFVVLIGVLVIMVLSQQP